MKRVLFAFIVLSLTATVAFSQKRTNSAQKKPAQPAVNVDEAIANYRFSEAEQALNAEISRLRGRKLDTSIPETKLRAVRNAKSKLHATERVTFIDSVVVRKDDLLASIRLSSETGSLDTYRHYFHKKDTLSCSLFMTQLKDRLIFARPTNDSVPMLYTSELVGDEWTKAQSLAKMGLGEHGDTWQNYPFLLADGQTLYYAAQGDESMGGYDIFMTRFDTDEQRYLTPENIGMPFNSPANDYLFVIDEYYNIGYFATDRNLPADSVCLYTFIPNETRRIYDAGSLEEGQLAAFAMINSIASTQQDAEKVSAARSRLALLKEEAALAASKTAATGANGASAFRFVVNDKLVYTSPSQFRSQQAQQKAVYYIEGLQQLTDTEQQLEALRQKYAKADANQRQQMSSQLMTLESQVEHYIRSLRQQEIELRKIENQ